MSQSSKSSLQKDGSSRSVRAIAVAVCLGQLKVMTQDTICNGDTSDAAEQEVS